MTADEVSGGEATVRRKLEDLGFTVEVKDQAMTMTWRASVIALLLALVAVAPASAQQNITGVASVNLTVGHHATCEGDCVRMRCREIVEVLPDEIGEEFVIHRKVKIKV
jgi:hypothetical protein